MRASWTLLFGAATDLLFLRQLQHLCILLKITCILCISLDPYAHVISFHSSPILLRNPVGFTGAHYIVEFVMTYSVIWIIFLNVSLLYTIFLRKANGSHERVQPPLHSSYIRLCTLKIDTVIFIVRSYM